VNLLAIESSCDETAAAVVRDGREILSSHVSSQIALHTPYGGVVPELAARAHLEMLAPVVDAALAGVEGGWEAAWSSVPPMRRPRPGPAASPSPGSPTWPATSIRPGWRTRSWSRPSSRWW